MIKFDYNNIGKLPEPFYSNTSLTVSQTEIVINMIGFPYSVPHEIPHEIPDEILW